MASSAPLPPLERTVVDNIVRSADRNLVAFSVLKTSTSYVVSAEPSASAIQRAAGPRDRVLLDGFLKPVSVPRTRYWRPVDPPVVIPKSRNGR
jgi:hypothetical protein